MKETRHLGVYGIILDNDNILLIRKCRGAYTGKLDLPGGSIEHGERPEETLVREIDEEVGVKVIDYKIRCADSAVVTWINPYVGNIEENLHHIGIIYDVEINKEDIIKNDADGYDSLGASWYKISELKEDEISPLTSKVLKLIK